MLITFILKPLMEVTAGLKKVWNSDSLSERCEQKICQDDLIDLIVGEYYLP